MLFPPYKPRSTSPLSFPFSHHTLESFSTTVSFGGPIFGDILKGCKSLSHLKWPGGLGPWRDYQNITSLCTVSSQLAVSAQHDLTKKIINLTSLSPLVANYSWIPIQLQTFLLTLDSTPFDGVTFFSPMTSLRNLNLSFIANSLEALHHQHDILNPWMPHLTSVEHLTIQQSNNYFHGPLKLPPFLKSLTWTTLNHGLLFSGWDPTHLPLSLESFDLEGPDGFGMGPPSATFELGLPISLTSLKLSRFTLKPEQLTKQALRRMTGLTSLFLQKSFVAPSSITNIVSVLPLRTLYLSGMNLAASTIKELAVAPNLVSLSLVLCKFPNDKIFEQLISNKSLTYLNVELSNCCPALVKTLRATHPVLKIDS